MVPLLPHYFLVTLNLSGVLLPICFSPSRIKLSFIFIVAVTGLLLLCFFRYFFFLFIHFLLHTYDVLMFCVTLLKVETTEYRDLNWDPRRNIYRRDRPCTTVGGPSSGLYPFTDMSATSILDLFLVTERLVPLVDRCTALHLGDNMSRYSPILIA